MRKKTQDERRQQIEEAAYELLKSKGYKGTSMLAVAKRARASNETLYAWYGNKQSLFRCLIESNAKAVRQALEDALDRPTDFVVTLDRIGTLLLELVTSERAIILNRVAAADVNDTNTLGMTLASAGRESVQPLIARLFDHAVASGVLRFDDSAEVAEVYLGLLIGDLQIRRVTGAMEVPATDFIQSRAVAARRRLISLFGA